MQFVTVLFTTLGLLLLCACDASSMSRSGSRRDSETGPAGTTGSTAGTGAAGIFGNANTPMAGTGEGPAAGAEWIGNDCPSGSAVATRVRPLIQVVVDGSVSMTDFQFRDSGTSRWDVLQAALADPVDGVLPRFEAAADFGLRVFQSTADAGGLNPSQCPYPAGSVIDPAPDNAAAVARALTQNRPSKPVGTTPTAKGLIETYAWFPEEGPDDDVRTKVVLLATDGEPNDCVNDFKYQTALGQTCPDPTQIVSCNASGICVCFTPAFEASLAAVESGSMRGVRTVVISLAAASGGFADHLQQLANAGAGMPRDAAAGAALFQPTDAAMLRAQLEEIIGGTVSCDVSLNGVVRQVRAHEGRVTLGTEELVFDDPNGWIMFDDHTIRVQGKACDDFKATPDAHVRASFPCEVFTPE